MHLDDAGPTPILWVDLDAFEHNVATMAATLPGDRLRPHVKAFKSTRMAERLVAAGHTKFCCATVAETVGMAAAGLGHDLLLANEVLDARRLGAAVEEYGARISVAVDSAETVAAAAAGGVGEVLVDVNVGLPRCGCEPSEAGRIAELARSAGLTVRGVMGYEGHIMGKTDRAERQRETERSMELLLAAHADVGGDLISAGGTGTHDLNVWANEIQAGSYLLMDTAYNEQGLPFRQALFVSATIISGGRSREREYLVGDAGLKAFGMDHGAPAAVGAKVWFCSDEHVTCAPDEAGTLGVGDRLTLIPAHVDPTVARHERYLVVRDGDVVDEWPIDLRHW